MISIIRVPIYAIKKMSILFILLFSMIGHAKDYLLGKELDKAALAIPRQEIKALSPKDWTVIVYMSADNDLKIFSARNIKQLAQIGSNQFVNIVVQLDIRLTGNQK